MGDAPANEAPELANTQEAPPQGTATPSPAFPHPNAAKKIEEAANKAAAEVEAKALPVRQWLEQNIVPTIYQGMMAAAKERPDDPIEFLAAYLIEHNPKKRQRVEKEGKKDGS